jgi:hypothetical protein
VSFLTANQKLKELELVRGVLYGEPPETGTFEIIEMAVCSDRLAGSQGLLVPKQGLGLVVYRMSMRPACARERISGHKSRPRESPAGP